MTVIGERTVALSHVVFTNNWLAIREGKDLHMQVCCIRITSTDLSISQSTMYVHTCTYAAMIFQIICVLTGLLYV